MLEVYPPDDEHVIAYRKKPELERDLVEMIVKCTNCGEENIFYWNPKPVILGRKTF